MAKGADEPVWLAVTKDSLHMLDFITMACWINPSHPHLMQAQAPVKMWSVTRLRSFKQLDRRCGRAVVFPPPITRRMLFMSGRTDPAGPTLYELELDEGADLVAQLKHIVKLLVCPSQLAVALHMHVSQCTRCPRPPQQEPAGARTDDRLEALVNDVRTLTLK